MNNLLSLIMPIFLLLNLNPVDPSSLATKSHFVELHSIFFENFGFLEGLRSVAEECALVFFIKQAAPISMHAQLVHFQKRIIYGCSAFIGINLTFQLFQKVSFCQEGIGLFAVVMPMGLLTIISLLTSIFYFILLVLDALKFLAVIIKRCI